VFELDTVKTLRCRECGKEYPATKIYACEDCFAPLDSTYDYESLQLTRRDFRERPKNIWRYFELLPISNRSNVVDLGVGYTPLHQADRLGKTLGLKNLYIKDDTVNPTYSFKDRPVAVAVSKALEFNATAIGCASTGNLAASSAAHAAKAGLPCYVFVPNDTEHNKIVQIGAYGANILTVNGTYDEANRLAIQVSEEYNWVFPNFNVRPYYVEGSKTLAFEVCEQLNWNPPDHVIVPTGSGALLCAIGKGFDEFKTLDLIEDVNIKITSAQPHGLAIGDPGDGAYVIKRVKESGGLAESATDEEIVEAIKLLARTEGVFAEPAGGVTVAVLKKLIENGDISSDETIVCYVTGNGLKTPQAILNRIPQPMEIEPSLGSFQTVLKPKEVTVWSR
jgi:threonine synthase